MLRLARFPFRYVPVLTMVVTEHAAGRLSADPEGLIRALHRFGSSWGVPEIRQRDWVRQRVLMYAMIGELDASLARRIARLHGYGTLARPSGYGWLRWSWWGLRRRPAAALRLLGLALGGRAFCRLNRVLHAADPELERVAGS